MTNSIVRWAGAVFFGLLAAPLAWGGTVLLSLGGSPWYLGAGVSLALVALLFALGRNRWAVSFYWVFMAGTAAWAWAESGADGWALTARLAGPLAVGAVLVLPILRRRHAFALAAVSLVLLASGGFWLMRGPTGSPTATWTAAAPSDWGSWGHDAGGTRFAGVRQITPANVGALEPAWTFRTGDGAAGAPGSFEATPLKLGDALYLCTPHNVVIALDAETGRQMWRHDPQVDFTGLFGGVCRGVAAHTSAAVASDQPCARRIIEATMDARLIALDAATGRPCPGFGGADGRGVNLKDGIGQLEPGRYAHSSPPTVVGDLIVVGGSVADNITVGGASGVIRAFDVRTGVLRWAWDMGAPDRTGAPPPGTAYTRGTPNSWSIFSADPALGLIFVPTGNSTPDFFGAHRSPASERYASALVALDAVTGRPRWTFQTVHHDLWDYDVAAQPVLMDFPTPAGMVPAVVQATKTGALFVLDRRTGRPLTEVSERAVPQTTVAGEWSAPTQPHSIGMPELVDDRPTEARMWGLTPLDQMWCRIAFRRARYDGPFTPPSLQGSLTSPGWVGGSNWGSVTVDPERGILVANAGMMAILTRLMPRGQSAARGGNTEADPLAIAPMEGTPYRANSAPFLSPLGVPCQQPPFGTLTGIDLKTRQILWRRSIGTAQDTGPFGWRIGLPLPMGMPNMGGAITTAGGVTFIGATLDANLRAFDTATGRELWRQRLPAGGQATPMTYVAKSGRQFVVIAAGGSAILGSRTGDYVTAFALPMTGRKP